MRILNEVMERVRTIIYGLYPQTYGISIFYLKNTKENICGEIDVRLLTGATKRIRIEYDIKKDELEIKEK